MSHSQALVALQWEPAAHDPHVAVFGSSQLPVPSMVPQTFPTAALCEQNQVLPVSGMHSGTHVFDTLSQSGVLPLHASSPQSIDIDVPHMLSVPTTRPQTLPATAMRAQYALSVSGMHTHVFDSASHVCGATQAAVPQFTWTSASQLFFAVIMPQTLLSSRAMRSQNAAGVSASQFDIESHRLFSGLHHVVLPVQCALPQSYLFLPTSATQRSRTGNLPH